MSPAQGFRACDMELSILRVRLRRMRSSLNEALLVFVLYMSFNVPRVIKLTSHTHNKDTDTDTDTDTATDTDTDTDTDTETTQRNKDTETQRQRHR